MTKYILAGGNDRENDEYPARLKQELPTPIGNVRMLSCFYSAPKDQWQEKAANWSKWFADNLGIKHYDYADYDNLPEKLNEADVVYFHGGTTKLLLEAIAKYPNLPELLKGKIVIGSSAGTNMISKNYWSSTLGQPGKGLGILDLNVMVHYGAHEVHDSDIKRNADDWEREKSVFRGVVGGAEPQIVTIPEGNIVVFEVK